MKILIPILGMLLLALAATDAGATDAGTGGSHAIQVEGTELAKLQSVADILAMLPGVSVDDDVVTVIGRGKPDIYIGNRKVTEFSELTHITADKVKEIEVLRHPGAEYDKGVESVIVIRLKPEKDEGFNLDNTLRFELTHKLSTNDELSLGWKRKGLTLGAFLGWNEKRMDFESESFLYKYKDHELVSKNESKVHPDYEKKSFTARLSAACDLDTGSSLTFNYSLVDGFHTHTWVPEASQASDQPDVRHYLALDYRTKIGGWDITLGNNSFIDNADLTTVSPAKKTYYLRSEYDLRTYAKASTGLWKGTLMLGLEHELDNMNVRMYEDNPSFGPIENTYYTTHAVHPDNSTDAFVSIIQHLGRWDIEAGLRYEHIHSVYRPCDDDGLMRFLDDFQPIIDYDVPEEYYLIPILVKKRKVDFLHDYLYPSLKISTKIGESEISLSHSENSVRPYLGVTRLRLNESELLNEKVLWTERTAATTLGWKRKWIQLGLTHTLYLDPICKTTSAANKYNAPDYQAVDIVLTLSPKLGIWSPMLHASLHKQWFEMPLASGKDKLKEPLANVTFNNTFSFPQNWTMYLNGLWHSAGADRNVHYYSHNLCVNASVQKSLPKIGLSFVLDASNLLRGSYSDTSCYVKDFYGISQGSKDRDISSVSLAVRYKF